PQGAPTCGQVAATLRTGPDRGARIKVQLSGPSGTQGLVPGDSIQVMHVPAPKGAPPSSAYTYFGVDRARSLSYLAVFFVLLVLLVARLRGLMALVGLVFAGGVVAKFMLPALIAGESGLWVALTGASTIMFVVLYLAHGISMRTSTALVGTLVGVAITAAVAHVAIGANRLSGVGDESGSFLSSMVNHLDFRGLLLCAIIIAGLGVLNDVTITQASAVWELRAAAPEMPRRKLFGSAMRIGRDHIASTIYTIVFAYTGAALSVLLLVELYDRPLLQLLNSEDIGEEVMRTLAGSMGLVLAVPLTTLIAVLTVAHARALNDPTGDTGDTDQGHRPGGG
ncbi:MAG: YibE/F family protein, partial [Marmoricola sp.]|nr:YibE/F family protein [Marmoricola sp.]